MAQVHVDPEVLREFASSVDEFNQTTRDTLSQVAGRLKEIGASTWQDQNYARFEEQFEQIQQIILRAIESLETEQVPYLRSLADRAEEVL